MGNRSVIFVSAVSDEFHRVSSDCRHTFSSYRDVLKHAFRTLAPHYEIIVQEDLVQGFDDLLETLDCEVARSLIVVHLVGDLAGAIARPACVSNLHVRHPNFLFAAPELRDALGDEGRISYTQWELYLAFHHQKYRLIFEALPSAPRAQQSTPTRVDRESQNLHRHRLDLSGAHRAKIADQGDLARKTIRSFLHFRVDPRVDPVEPTDEAVAEAWSNRQTIIQEVVRAIRKPDPRRVPVSDPANAAAFIAAVRTSAERWTVDLATIITIAAQHEKEVRAVAEEQPSSQAFYEQALAELALGDFTAAQQSARRAAHNAVRLLGEEPHNSDLHRQDAINALLLVHDAAVAAHAVTAAVTALEEAGGLVDKERQPLLWAEVHEPLAEFLLDHAQYGRAEEIISDIVDIREEHQGANDIDLAVTLLLWAKLLYAQAKFPGARSVATRAERIFANQKSPNAGGLASAVGVQACVLLEEERVAEAEPLLRRVLAIDEQYYGKEHPNVAAARNNLAELLSRTDRREEAEPHFRLAVTIAENVFGAGHPITATYYSNLAKMLKETDHSTLEAESLARRALAIHEQTFGPEHPKVGIDLQTLGTLLIESGSLKEAEVVLRRAAATTQKNFGAKHPEHIRSSGWLALLLGKKGRVEDAELLMRSALTLAEEVHGADHFITCGYLYNLAGLLASTGRPTEAQPLMQRAAEIVLRFQQSNEQPHPKWQAVLERYAEVLAMLGVPPHDARDRINQLGERYGCRIHFAQ
jgi:tetratricopeptide (TPR) repeat protein